MSTYSESLCLPLFSTNLLRLPDMPSNHPGSVVAGSECLRALLRFSPKPVTLFLPEHLLQNAQNELQLLQQNAPSAQPIALHPFPQIPQVLQNQPCLALHNLAGPHLDLMAYIRSQFAPRLLPITCMEYGFSFQSFLLDAIVRLLLVPT